MRKIRSTLRWCLVFERRHTLFFVRILLCAISGVLVFTSFPTYDIYPLLFFSLVPLLWATQKVRPWRAFLYGFFMGSVTNLGGFYWIEDLLIEFGHMDIGPARALCVLLCSYQGLVFAIWIALYRWLNRRYSVPSFVYGVGLFVFVEFVFPLIFPWFFANGLYLFHAFVQSADLFGVLGVSALIVAFNLALWEVVKILMHRFGTDPQRLARRMARPLDSLLDTLIAKLSEEGKPTTPPRAETPDDEPFRPQTRSIIIVAVLTVLNVIYGVIQISRYDSIMAESESIRIGLIEADIGIGEKEPLDKRYNNMLIHQNLSATIADDVDLVVWPESSYHPLQMWAYTEEFSDLDLAMWGSLLTQPFARIAASGGKILRPLFSDLSREPYLFWYIEAVRRVGPKGKRFAQEIHYYYVPEQATYMRPGWAPLVDDYRQDYPSSVLTNYWRDNNIEYLYRFHVANRQALQRGFNTPILFGTLTSPNPGREEIEEIKYAREVYNTAILLDENGVVLGKYHKNYLLLFGEYVPFANDVPFIFEWFPEASNLRPGTDVEVFPFGDFIIGVMICYEDIIPQFSRKLAKKHPNVIINVTNDAWFGKTSEPYLHMALSTFRAIETRTWLIRSTNTGVSCFIDANGRILQQTRLTDPETLISAVPMMAGGNSLYILIGDLLGWLSLIFTLLVSGRTIQLSRRQRKEKRAQGTQKARKNPKPRKKR